jgi:hypothetical protein
LTGLDRLQQNVLDAFFEIERQFFLTGGAALAGFHLRHRRTLDLDLFTAEDRLEEGESALRVAAQRTGATVEGLRASPTFRRFLLRRGEESVVVDLVRDLAPQIEQDKQQIGQIMLDSPREIMANKLCTLLSRAELRDLVDVRALEEAGYTVEEHLPLATRKEAGLTAAQLAWVLSEIELGDDATPPGGVSVEDLRAYLTGLQQRLARLAYPG